MIDGFVENSEVWEPDNDIPLAELRSRHENQGDLEKWDMDDKIPLTELKRKSEGQNGRREEEEIPLTMGLRDTEVIPRGQDMERTDEAEDSDG